MPSSEEDDKAVHLQQTG